MTDAYIFDAVRTPRGKGKTTGKLHTARPVELARAVLQAIPERNQLDPVHLEDIIFGCVTQIGEQGANIAKTSALYAGYPETVPGYTLNRFCGSGLEAVNQAAAYIMSGQVNLLLAGGVESMSRIPLGSDGGAWSSDPEIAIKTGFVPQGISADLIATLNGFSRQDVDNFAVESQKRAGVAWKENRFAKSIVPVCDINGQVILDHDEHLRPDTTLEGLAGLKPSFQLMGENYGFDAVAIQKYPQLEQIVHVHHAGNSSGIVDGASAVLLGNPETGAQLGLKPRAKIRAFAVTSSEPTIMLTGPIPSTEKVLKKAGLTINDIDLFEVNEAFAAVVLNFMKKLNVPHEKVNVNGGAIALGHPLGATGSMLLGTVLDELERQDKTLGLITLCIGGGMGIATVVERI